ncbi:MAG: HEAT repeat domain-containing protein [Alkalinema sp. RU_4_3]|nr:HEAT repeat domain-containing protein [Alkalinema sp. RU_4_3]
MPRDREGVDQLVQKLRQNAEANRDNEAVFNQLQQIGEPAVSKLIPLLQDKTPKVRSSAASTLGSMRESAKSAIPSLIPLLKDQDKWVRSSATQALKKLGYQP